jgi:hypothetical protein
MLSMPRILIFVLVLLGPSVVQAEDSLATVLQRAGVYAANARREMAGFVAEETYVQNIRRVMGVTITLDGKGSEPVSHRTLKSDIVMVRTADRYAEFRDVFAVDGRTVRDRQDRLTKLFLSTQVDINEQLMEIASESARYNIGSVYRNWNTPALALVFLEPEQQARSRFKRIEDTNAALAKGWQDESAEPFVAPDTTWAIEFQEVRKGTLIRRQGSNGDLPARGRFWIDPATGRVVLTELVIGDPLIRCTVNVRYAPLLAGSDRLFPAEMRERYLNGVDRVTITGTATYGRIRSFGVQVDEDIPIGNDPNSERAGVLNWVPTVKQHFAAIGGWVVRSTLVQPNNGHRPNR